LNELDRRVATRRRYLDALSGEARAVLQQGQLLQATIAELTGDVADLDRVTGLLNSLGEERQQRAQATIEQIVTRGLQTIFDPTLSFHIVQSIKGRASNVEFVVRDTREDGDIHETGVMDARGGGLAATIGFLLRVVIMLLDPNKNQERLLVLDETFAHVSAEYLPALGQFLRELVDRTGVQIILVTHQDEFEEHADRVYRFSQIEGKTRVTDGR